VRYVTSAALHGVVLASNWSWGAGAELALAWRVLLCFRRCRNRLVRPLCVRGTQGEAQGRQPSQSPVSGLFSGGGSEARCSTCNVVKRESRPRQRRPFADQALQPGSLSTSLNVNSAPQGNLRFELRMPLAVCRPLLICITGPVPHPEETRSPPLAPGCAAEPPRPRPKEEWRPKTIRRLLRSDLDDLELFSGFQGLLSTAQYRSCPLGLAVGLSPLQPGRRPAASSTLGIDQDNHAAQHRPA